MSLNKYSLVTSTHIITHTNKMNTGAERDTYPMFTAEKNKTKITKGDVVNKFKELHTKYFVGRGYMIHTVSDAFSKQFCEMHLTTGLEWKVEYNQYAETSVRVVEIKTFVFGKPILVALERPIKQVHRSEFEYYFAFGGHCQGYTDTRLIARFLGEFDEELNYEELLHPMAAVHVADETIDETIDETYIKNALKLLVMGGYVKYWKAYNELKDWFMENVDESIQKELSLSTSRSELEKDWSTGPEIDGMTKSIFEDYQVCLHSTNKSLQEKLI